MRESWTDPRQAGVAEGSFTLNKQEEEEIEEEEEEGSKEGTELESGREAGVTVGAGEVEAQ